MDVQYNTIDVRYFLSSADSPNSPISAPDLRLLVSQLDAHSLRIKFTVQSYLLSHQADFASLFSRCSDVVSKSENFSSQVIALLNLISDLPIESDGGKIIGEIVKKRRELMEKREILELVGVVLELDRKFGVVRKSVESGRVVEAAEGLRELKLLLGVSRKDVIEGEPLVYEILRNHWNDCFEEIQDLLLRFVEAAVRFEQEGNTVHIKSQACVNEIDGLELYTILRAMDAADILDYGLTKVADLIIKYVITLVSGAAGVLGDQCPSFGNRQQRASDGRRLIQYTIVDYCLRLLEVTGLAGPDRSGRWTRTGLPGVSTRVCICDCRSLIRNGVSVTENQGGW